jgi:hypothetical protein
MRLNRTLRQAVKQGNLFPAIVLDVHGTRATVRLSTNGVILRNLYVVGGPVVIGDVIKVDFGSYAPIVKAPRRLPVIPEIPEIFEDLPVGDPTILDLALSSQPAFLKGPTCLGYFGADPNGPFAMGLNQTVLQSAADGQGGTQILSTTGGPLGVWIRSSAYTHLTKMLLSGSFQQSDNDGVSWQTWPNNSGLHARAFSGGSPISADMSIFTGAQSDARGGILSPSTVKLVDTPDYWEFYLDPGPEIFSGPGETTLIQVAADDAIIDSRTFRSNSIGGSDTDLDDYGAYRIIYSNWPSLGFGRVRATWTRTGGTSGHTINVQGLSSTTQINASYTPFFSQNFEQYGNNGVTKIHFSSQFTPAGDTYYFNMRPSSGIPGEFIILRLDKVEWIRASDSAVFNLWTPNSITRIKRVTTISGNVYNICFD